MVFSSNEFLFFYLPLALFFYFAVPTKLKNLVLFLFSLVFYAWERPLSLILMLFVILLSYCFGILLTKKTDSKDKKAILVWGLIINIGILVFFKYTDFLLGEISKIPSLAFVETLGITLPIGISFYIFQSVSYLIDVYRENCRPQKSLVAFGTYISMFPQLIAGPIVRYSDIEGKLEHRSHSVSKSSAGARRFVLGLAKKVLLADTAGALWEEIRDIPSGESSVALMWLGIVMYSFQIYFDFSGYSDMAIGLGKILGFDFPENFNYPYISKSITEFWRRWHITLSSFFKEYVYIPLGGSRRGVPRLVLNLLVVWLLTGLWHGADENFVLWGFYYFVLLVLEKLFLKRWLDRAPSIISRAYTLLLVAIGWLIFSFKSEYGGLRSAFSYLLGMFGMGGVPLYNGEFIYIFVGNLSLMILLILASTPIPKHIFRRICEKVDCFNILGDAVSLISAAVLVALFLLCIVYISSSEYRPNIYFEF